MIDKNGVWSFWDNEKPDEETPVPAHYIPPPLPPPKPPTPPKPPRPRYKFNLAKAYDDLASKSSGNEIIDNWIKNAGLNPREAAAVCMFNRGYTPSQIARLLKISPYRLDAVLKVAWGVIDRIWGKLK